MDSFSQGSTTDVGSRQSQGIHDALVPIFQTITHFHKKADYAWVFSIKNKTVGRSYDKLSIRGQHNLSQMTDPFTSRCCLFCGVEVKSPRGSTDNSLAQLAVWFSAGLRKTLNLLNGKSEMEQVGPAWKLAVLYSKLLVLSLCVYAYPSGYLPVKVLWIGLRKISSVGVVLSAKLSSTTPETRTNVQQEVPGGQTLATLTSTSGTQWDFKVSPELKT